MKETIAKINKTKSWFFWEDKQNWQTTSQTHQWKKGENQINKIRNKKEEVTTDNTEIQSIVREYYEQLYANKMDNLEEMNRYLEKISLQRLNQEEVDIMNNAVTNTEIETMIKNLPKNKSPGPDGFRGILSNIQRRANAYFSETLPKNCKGKNTSKLILWDHNHLHTKTRQRQYEKIKLQANITN